MASITGSLTWQPLVTASEASNLQRLGQLLLRKGFIMYRTSPFGTCFEGNDHHVSSEIGVKWVLGLEKLRTQSS